MCVHMFECVTCTTHRRRPPAANNGRAGGTNERINRDRADEKGVVISRSIQRGVLVVSMRLDRVVSDRVYLEMMIDTNGRQRAQYRQCNKVTLPRELLGALSWTLHFCCGVYAAVSGCSTPILDGVVIHVPPDRLLNARR